MIKKKHILIVEENYQRYNPDFFFEKDGKFYLKKGFDVHHIDKNSLNNDIHNLLVFNTSDDHKRFHNSKYAWLTYDEETHFFSCVMKR